MPVVGLLINETKPEALVAAARLSTFLSARGVTTRAQNALAAQIADTGCCEAGEDELGSCDFVVVFGGDGTLLGAARLLAPFQTPLLGVHLGHFGFMTETPKEMLEEAVLRVLEGDFQIEERLMLSGVVRSRQDAAPLLAMNDLVVATRAVRMVHVRTQIGDDTLTTYAADGVIVSSPTGSTGYSLSAGGPLVHPSAPVLIITPISPHTLNARTLVIPETETVHLTINDDSRDAATVAIDGQMEVPLLPGDTISISRAPHRARFVTVGGPSFYEKIRSRWHYGERVSA